MAPLSSAGTAHPHVSLVQTPVPWFCALRNSSTDPPFPLQQIDNRLWWGHLRRGLWGGAAGNEHQREEVKCVSVRRWAVGTTASARDLGLQQEGLLGGVGGSGWGERPERPSRLREQAWVLFPVLERGWMGVRRGL